MFGKKKIKNFGKIYQYLLDADLRLKEAGRQRITIKNAYFSDEKFNDQWWYFDFVDCEFTGQYKIDLGWLGNCTLTNCKFNGIFGFTAAKDTKFLHCFAGGESILSFGKDTLDTTIFEQCSFVNTLSDPNHVGAILCHGEILFIDCKAEGFALKGSKKLTLRHCTTISAILGTAPYGLFINDLSKLPRADFLLEDCDFTRGVETESLELNNFTMKNCKVSVFKTWRSEIRNSVMVEGIREGFISTATTGIKKSLTIRNCSFFTTAEGHSFKCNTSTPEYSLIDNVQCGLAPVNAICAAGPKKESDWRSIASNKSTIIRNCDIPHLHVDWAQTEHLRIENSTFDTLLIRNGRIGKLEIIGCKLKKLDVSNTKVQEQDVRVQEGGKISGLITVTTGSNIKLLPKD